jgi:uncharacterized protein (TIGR03905 family)
MVNTDMIEYQYIPDNRICVSMMKVFIDETTDTIHSIAILGGCHGNFTAIMKLLRGRKVQDVIKELDGIQCGRRGTSCPDQIAKALKQYLDQKGSK